MADFNLDKKYNYNWQSSKFKDFVLSGSNISQFINDAGYVTSSVAISASYALTASYVKIAQTASYFSGSISNAISASYATTSSYALNGGVTQLLAGSNITLSPAGGTGAVTVSSLGGSLYNTATGSYGSFYDTGSVTATSATAVYSMSFSTTDISNGVSISASSGNNTRVKFTNAGTYNLQFSSQFSNSDNLTQDIVIWVRKNGTDIPDSSGVVGVPPFKAGSNGQVIASWNYYLSLSANDYIQLCWHVEQANVITLETIAAGTSPTHPRTPSTILTATRVDTFLSNTGSFSGSFTGSLTGSVTNYETAWTSYTPVWTAASVNPVIGNGTIEGWYKVIGKTCFVRGNIAMGSTTTFGSGEWYVSMPFTASHADAILMSANLLDNGSAWYNALLNGARAGFNYKTAIQYQAVGGTANDVNATQPFTWANTDRFLWNGTYELI
jgi:hypothetical protein